MGDKVQLISSGDETAREVSTILYHSKMLNEGEEQSDHLFLTTGKIGLFKEIASKWFGQPIENVKHIHLEKNNSRIHISKLLRNQEFCLSRYFPGSKTPPQNSAEEKKLWG